MLQLTTIFFLIAGSVWATLHIISLKLFLYWRFLWLDIPMHFLGGVVVALFIFTLYDMRIIVHKNFLTVPKVVAFVLLVAVSWELYEYLIGVPIQEGFVVDTVTDLAMGVIGGYIGFLVAKSISQLR